MRTRPAGRQPLTFTHGHSIYVRDIARRMEAMACNGRSPAPAPAPAAAARAPRSVPRTATPVGSEFFEEQ